MLRSCQGQGSFTNTFFSDYFSFFQPWRDVHLKIKPWPKLWKYLRLRLILKKFCHVQLHFDIFVKLAVQIGDCIKKHLLKKHHYASGNGDFMQSLPLFVISWMVTCALMSWLQSSFKFASSCKSNSWRSYRLKMSLLVWWERGEGAISTLESKRGLPWGIPFGGT